MQGRANRTKKQKRYAGGIAIILAAVLLTTGKVPILAVESDRDNGIRSVRVSDDQIAASTLIIGTYLIDLAGLSDHIYELARDSAGAFSQSGMYYKSELAGGQWFDITDAVSIRDITDAGTPVLAEVIEELEFTHRVAADGTVTDLRVQAAVNEFDIPDPYDLTELEELKPVKMRYQYLQSKETKTPSDEKYLEIMEIFYGLSIEDDITRDCDVSLDALSPYKLDVIARGKPGSWTEAVTTVMEGEDARRRVQSLNTLDIYLDELLKKASGQDQEGLSPEETKAFYDSMGEQEGRQYDTSIASGDSSVNNSDNNDGTEEEKSWFEQWRGMSESYQKFLARAGTYRSVTLDENFQVDTDMIQAIGEAKSNVKTSIGKYTGKLLSEGTAASTQAIYRYSKELIDCARAYNTSGSDEATLGLANLLNILRSVIEDSDSERDSLENGLVEQALSVWRDILSDGAGRDYRMAEEEGAGQPALTAFLSQRETDADNARMEYQTMLTEMWKRMSNSLAQIDAGERMDGIARLEALPPGDAAQNRLLGTVERHMEWLRKSLAKLAAASADSTALDQLLEERSALEQQRLDALDENNLAEAGRLAAEIEAVENDVGGLREELYNTLTNPDSSAADRARASAGMTEGSAGKLIDELAGNITSGILDGADISGLDNDIAALSELAAYDADAASEAVSRIQDALDGKTDSDTGPAAEISAQMSAIERRISDEDREGGMLSEERMAGLLADYFDDDSGASDQDKAGALIALSRYAQDTHNEAAGMLAVSMANRFAARGSYYLYEKYDREAAPYISLQTVSRIFGYRYLFDDVHCIVTLQKAETYYIFTAGELAYAFTDGSEGRLSAGPAVQKTLYISSDDGKRIFGCKGYYVPKCSIAVAETAAMEPVIESVYDKLMSAD